MRSPDARRLSLYQVKPNAAGRLITQAGKELNTESYSRSKYGDVDVAREYGFELADLFATQHPQLIFGNEKVLVTSSAFKSLPTSSHNIAQGFIDEVNYLRYLEDLPPTDKIKIVRPNVIEGDFGQQSQAERQASLANEPFYVDKELVKGAHLVVIDDVVITGSNERKIQDTVDNLGLLSLWFLYAVEMDAEAAAKDPAIENEMNHSHISNLQMLGAVVEAQKQYAMLQRVTKSILRPSNSKEELREFLKARDNDFLYGLYTASINDAISNMQSYRGSIEVLEAVLQERGLLSFGRLVPPGFSPERDIMHDNVAISKLKAAKEEGQPLRVAFLDIDDTISGTPDEQRRLRQLLEEQGYIIVFTTSRSSEMVMSEDAYGETRYNFNRPKPKLAKVEGRRVVGFADSLENEAALFNPDIIISSTGTDILTKERSGGYFKDRIFERNVLHTNSEWRSNTLELLRLIDPDKALFNLSYIESPQNYDNGDSYVYPHDNRIRIEFTSDGDLSASQRKNEFQRRLKVLYDNKSTLSTALQREIANMQITDESNPNSGRFALYLTPQNGTKASSVDYVIDQLCAAVKVDRRSFEVLIAGDSMPDLEMGLNATIGTRARFFVPRGARIAQVFTDPAATEFAGTDVQGIKSRILQVDDAIRISLPNGRTRKVVLGDHVPSATSPASSFIGFLEQEI